VDGKLGKNNAGRLAHARQARAPPILPVAVWTCIECVHTLEFPSFRQARAESASTSSESKSSSSTSDGTGGSDSGQRQCKGQGSASSTSGLSTQRRRRPRQEMVSSIIKFFPAGETFPRLPPASARPSQSLRVSFDLSPSPPLYSTLPPSPPLPAFPCPAFCAVPAMPSPSLMPPFSPSLSLSAESLFRSLSLHCRMALPDSRPPDSRLEAEMCLRSVVEAATA
jgi:hypothetical protein